MLNFQNKLKQWRFKLASTLSRQEKESCPQDVETYIQLAEESMNQKEFTEALERWAIVREKFPNHHAGYSRAAQVCLQLKRFELAETLSRQGMEHCPQEVDSYIQLAEVSMKQKEFSEALERWAVVREKFSNHHVGYRRAAQACLQLKRFELAEKICIDGITCMPRAFGIYKIYGEVLLKKGGIEKAELYYGDMLKKFPNSQACLLEVVRFFIQINKFAEANELLICGIRKFPASIDLWRLYAEIPLHEANEPTVDVLKDVLERELWICASFPSDLGNLIKALIIFQKVLQHTSDDNILRTRYELIFNLLLKKISDASCDEHRKLKENFPKKIAFFCETLKEIKYYLPIIKHIAPKNVDIIVAYSSDNDKLNIENYCLAKYDIYFDNIDKCNLYEYIVCDINYKPNLYIGDGFKSHIIGFRHDSSSGYREMALHNIDLAFVQCKKNIKYDDHYIDSSYLSDNSIKNLQSIPTRSKCELAYTGPYHIGEYFQKRHLPKEELRRQLGEKLGRIIPDDKPIVTIFEGEVCDINLVIASMNAIKDICTVVFRPLGENKNSRLSEDIIIAPFEGLAPNLLRFTVDYIMAECWSGTFVSSVMLGINVIPYYTKIIKRKGEKNKHLPEDIFSNKIPKSINAFSLPQEILLYKFDQLFDITDLESIKKAILEKQYLEWYHGILPELQKEAFGDYMLDESPKKTAEYIMRFAKNGTLGKDCSAIYLKEKYFK